MTNPKTVAVPVELLREIEDQLVDLSNEKTANHGIYRESEKTHDADVLQRVRLLIAPPTPPAEHVQTVMVLEHEGRKFTVPGWIGPHIAELLAKDKTAGEWLPIETAPKDGRDVLVSSGTGNSYIACWFTYGWRDTRCFDRDPRWWQPLPTAPSSEGGR